MDAYRENTSKLCCFLGIKTCTALSFIVETGDFNRFRKASSYSAFLGLIPGEDSSSDNINRTALTKAGNKHLRGIPGDLQGKTGLQVKRTDSQAKREQSGSDRICRQGKPPSATEVLQDDIQGKSEEYLCGSNSA